MKVIKYKHEQETELASNILPCAPCQPIIFQVFFSDFEDGQLMDYVWDVEPWYFDFDFANNGYGKFKAALEEEVEEDKRLDDIYNATPIETRDIREIERDLASLMPLKPERTVQTSYIYDHCAKGNEYFHQGDYSNAVEHYEAALALRSQAEEVKLSLAMAYYFLGDYSNARRVIDGYTYPNQHVNQFYYLLQHKIAS